MRIGGCSRGGVVKTKQQIGECVYRVLHEKMDHPEWRAFHTDAKLRDDLGLDSSATLQLLVNLELELGLSLPEAAVMNQDFQTVRAVAKVLFDAQERPASGKILEHDDDIKLHCFVSCLSEILKRKQIDQRAFYFGVWDSGFVVDERFRLRYHHDSIRHEFFMHWYERLHGVKVVSWYDESASKDENCARLVSLVEDRTPEQHVMVMLDMHQLPERANDFNKDPFPHYLMLSATIERDTWFVYDPDYRWEGVAKAERLLRTMHHPAVRGGYVFSEAGAHEARPEDVAAYFEVCYQRHDFPMTDAIRAIVDAHLDGQDGLSLADLPSALEEIPILAVRKYAYEHGFAFFWRELALDEAEFDHWLDVIEELVKSYKLVLFHAMKLALTGDRGLRATIGIVLSEQRRRERLLKERILEVYSAWRLRVLGGRHASLRAAVMS